MIIRTGIVILGVLSLFFTGCPEKKQDARAEAAEREKADKGEDKDPDDGDEGEEKGDAEKKDEGGW